MHAKLIESGDGCPPPGPGDCCTGDVPTADCILLGGIPYGNCEQGAG